MGSCLFSGHPFTGTCMTGNLTVHGHGVFHDHIWRVGRNIMKKYIIQGVALLFQHMGFHGNPRILKLADSLSCHQCIWIIGAHINLADTVLYDRPGTWRLLAVMAAWLQSHIHLRSCGICFQIGKGTPLGVQLTVTGMIPFRQNLSISDDHGSHQRIGIDMSLSLAGQFDGSSHIFFIHISNLHGSSDIFVIYPSNSTALLIYLLFIPQTPHLISPTPIHQDSNAFCCFSRSLAALL